MCATVTCLQVMWCDGVVGTVELASCRLHCSHRRMNCWLKLIGSARNTFYNEVSFLASTITSAIARALHEPRKVWLSGQAAAHMHTHTAGCRRAHIHIVSEPWALFVSDRAETSCRGGMNSVDLNVKCWQFVWFCFIYRIILNIGKLFLYCLDVLRWILFFDVLYISFQMILLLCLFIWHISFYPWWKHWRKCHYWAIGSTCYLAVLMYTYIYFPL